MKSLKEYEGPFAKRLQELMQEHDPPLSLLDLANETGLFTYEHARKMVRGRTLPSPLMTRELARFFKVGEAELDAVVREDKFQRQFGEAADKPIFNPEVQPFATAWPDLTEEQQKDLIKLLKSFVVANRKTKERQKGH